MTASALIGRQLELAQATAAGPSLEVHDAQTGALIGTIPVPGGAHGLDVHANIATFIVGKTVRGVRLATGKQATIAMSPTAIVEAQIDDAGLVYAYNTATGVKGRREARVRAALTGAGEAGVVRRG